MDSHIFSQFRRIFSNTNMPGMKKLNCAKRTWKNKIFQIQKRSVCCWVVESEDTDKSAENDESVVRWVRCGWWQITFNWPNGQNTVSLFRVSCQAGPYRGLIQSTPRICFSYYFCITRKRTTVTIIVTVMKHFWLWTAGETRHFIFFKIFLKSCWWANERCWWNLLPKLGQSRRFHWSKASLAFRLWVNLDTSMSSTR